MGYGQEAAYGDLQYKQDQGDSPGDARANDKKHFQALVNAWPVEELLEAEE